MKRTALQRKTPLRRGSRLKRWNPERREKMHARNYGERAKRIREMPCIRCKRSPLATKIDASHVVSRKMGGCGGDRRDLVPMCRACHLEYGATPISGSWERAQRAWGGLNLRAEADALALMFDAEGLE